MPIAKVVKGSRGGWYSCDKYITSKEQAKLLETNMAGDNPAERSMEYRLCIEKNLRASNTVLHIAISPHPEDIIDDQMWCDIAQRIRGSLGYTKNQYLVATHSDTGLRHGHLLINRVDVEGKVPNDWQDKRKTEEILRQLEEEFKLTPVTSSWEVAMKSSTTGQFQKALKEQKQFEDGKRASPPKPPVFMVLQEIISLATSDKPTLTELARQVREAGCQNRNQTHRARYYPRY